MNDSNNGTLVLPDELDWCERTEICSVSVARRVASMLDLDPDDIVDGSPLPRGWQFTLMALVMPSISWVRLTNPAMRTDASCTCADTCWIAPAAWPTNCSPSAANCDERAELVSVSLALKEMWSMVTDICSIAAAVAVVASDVWCDALSIRPICPVKPLATRSACSRSWQNAKKLKPRLEQNSKLRVSTTF